MRDIHLSLNRREILHGVDLTVREGELAALLGRNGSGKSTLLRTACGFVKPSRGTCQVVGQDTLGLGARQLARLVAYIPQRQEPIGGRTAWEVALMGLNPYLSLLGAPSPHQKENAAAVFDWLGIADYRSRLYNQLSQGQQQLVILARTLIQDAPIMLMDEPDSAMDFLNRHDILSKIRQIVHGQPGRAGLLALHDPNFAMAYCDRLFLLQDGAIIATLDMARTPMEELRAGLSQLYGHIVLIRHGESYLMGKMPDGKDAVRPT